jgi:hypothetical protein
MKVQGWNLPVAAAATSPFLQTPVMEKRGVAADLLSPERLELLRSIKQRIKTGFYNSDAVVDDIGHSFAQALDQTI